VKLEDGRISYARPGMSLDLNGIAQGFAADEAASILKAAGIKSALIEVGGGEFVCVGGKPYNTPFNIGIRKPVRESEETIASLLVAHHAMATSGDYERYFEADGIRYSHLIDPRTGRPKAVPSTSVTVVGPSCSMCDSLGTACSLLSPEDALRLIADMPGYEVLIAEKTTGEPTMHRSVGIYGDKGVFAHSASMEALK
jgi:thiamine biosynthesis lipoprotein